MTNERPQPAMPPDHPEPTDPPTLQDPGDPPTLQDPGNPPTVPLDKPARHAQRAEERQPVGDASQTGQPSEVGQDELIEAPLSPPAPPPGPLRPGPEAAASPDPAAGRDPAADPAHAAWATGPQPGMYAPGTYGTGAYAPGTYAMGTAPPPGAMLARYGLVRPLSGRVFAGVCAAIGRATNTDPVLWRVLFAVVTLFGGVGLLAYLVGWLLIPAEGDTASPIESIFGRGRSRTSVPLAILGSLAAFVVFAIMVGNDESPALAFVGAIIIFGAALLISRRGPRRQPAAQQVTDPPYGAPGAPEWPVSGMPTTFPASGPPVPQPQPQGAPWPPAAGPTSVPATGYREPFAPHGPFAPQGPFPPVTERPKLGLYGPYPPHVTGQAAVPSSVWPISGDPLLAYPGLPYSGPPAPPAPPPPRPKRPKSRLGRATLSATFLVIGILAAIDMSGVSITPSAYPALALTIVGLGLVAGAWVGRARLLIALGVLLSIGLLGATADSDEFNGPGIEGPPRAETIWAPTSPAEIQPRYSADAGHTVLDLSQVDFTAWTHQTEVTQEWGRMQVILPPDVDVEVRVQTDYGDVQVFGNRWNGVGKDRQTVTDLGADGAGGGNLVLILTMGAGSVEVTR